MKKRYNNIIIIGCSIPSLYAAIKYIDLGFKVSIVEKKNSYLPINDSGYNNFRIYNDNHKAYINLLKKFQINSQKITDINMDTKLMTIINNVINKSKLIPNNILMTYTFTSLCKQLISEAEINELNSYENIFHGIFNVINAFDCIQIFTYDLNVNTNYYYLNNDNIQNLIKKMIMYINNKHSKIIYNTEIKSIKYIKKKFILGTNTPFIMTSDILLTTMSRNNLLSFTFWNTEQKILLNSISVINACIINNMINNLLNIKLTDNEQLDNNIRGVLLSNLHIVYPNFPNKSKYIYICNNGINNILLREKIKKIYNDKFLVCSESFSKNNMFITYSLEYIDQCIHFMPK